MTPPRIDAFRSLKSQQQLFMAVKTESADVADIPGNPSNSDSDLGPSQSRVRYE
ncbi:hypothetical protein RUM44_009260 [Polyplax serrata]|uniref:Uncharacterized protein n=1 Tax=Polyplax serrata TaxID=468196 RepID=A0ABR1ATP7_POLSC